MNVLITGGTGFIGSRLALRYLEKKASVRVLGQENSPAEAENRRLIEAKGAEVVLASVVERARLFELVQGVDIVYHLAAAQHEANVPDQRFWDVNVTGTKNVIEASEQARIKRFVHGSTIGVYGSLHGPIDEQSPLNPDNIYGKTKLEAEKVVLSFRERLPVVVIRISETYGPGDRRLLKLFRAIRKGAFVTVGSGKNKHHPIYIDDLIDGLLLAATVETAVGKIFVLSGTKALTTDEMVAAIANEMGKSVPPFHIPILPFLVLAAAAEAVLQPLGVQPPLHRRRMDFFRKSFIFSPEASKKFLGFVPKVQFHHGVAETARWYSEMGYL